MVSKAAGKASKPHPPPGAKAKKATPSLVQTSAKKHRAKLTKGSKFKDTDARENLDRHTSQLLAETRSASKETQPQDPFSYNLPSSADQRRTRAQLDQAALALDRLMNA